MKCKECKENIPSKVKYCPECGALVNDIKYNVADFSRYSPQLQQEIQRKKTYTPEYDEETGRPAVFDPNYRAGRKKAKPNVKIPVIIAIGVFVLIFVSSFIMNVADEFDFSDIEFEDAFEFVTEFDINSAESLANEYVNNIVDSDCMQDTELFRMHSLIDWELVFKDIIMSNPEYETAYDESVIDDMHTFGEETLRNSFDIVNGRYTDDFTPFFFYTELMGSYPVDGELEVFVDFFSEAFAKAGLDMYDYFDPDDITRLFRYEYYITAEDEECIQTQDFGKVNVTVAEIYGGYYVLYDNTYIQTLIEAIK